MNRKEGKWMASIREVAKRAGVSPATVSRVINGTARVDEEKRERVEKRLKKPASDQTNLQGRYTGNHQR